MKIAAVMSPCAYTIPASSSVDDAAKLMEAYGFRHLPVIESEEVIGMLTERDITLSKVLSNKTLSCGEACSPNFFIVGDSATVASVAQTMAERKLNCVLIADDDGLFVGIFTTTDACRLLHLALTEREDEIES